MKTKRRKYIKPTRAYAAIHGDKLGWMTYRDRESIEADLNIHKDSNEKFCPVMVITEVEYKRLISGFRESLIIKKDK